MANPKATLLRLRRYAREETLSQLRKAEADHAAQSARLSELRAATRRAREGLDVTDADALAHYLAWRLRQEIGERRETLRLHQEERKVHAARERHAVRVRDELSMTRVLDTEAAERAEAAEAIERAEADDAAGMLAARAAS